MKKLLLALIVITLVFSMISAGAATRYGMIYIKTKERVKLRLSGVNIKNNNGPAIYFDDADKAFITITEDTVNYLEDGTSYSDKDAKAALFSNDTLEIKGKGVLTATEMH